MTLSRRRFVQSTGAVVVCFSVTGCGRDGGATPDSTGVHDGRIEIKADGTVDLYMGKVELGQGIGTALAQIAAAELGVPFGRIRLLGVDTDYSPDESYTFSSISVQQSGPKVREAAAKARRLMDRSATRSRDRGKPILGTSAQRIDIPGKLFGDPSYLQDFRPEGMVHARVLRPPAARAQISGFQPEETARMPGVLKVVRDGQFVAVIAAREGQARQAVSRLAGFVAWTVAEDLPETQRIYEWLRSAGSRLEDVATRGDVKFPTSGERVFRASYQRPYQAHASISPSAAVALYQDAKLTVWCHAQGMYPLRAAIAHTLGLSAQQVRCVHMEASGCFGHNGADDAACDAAALAMHYPGRPVRLQWERSDEFSWEPLGPAMHIETQAALTAEGVISDWQYDVWSCPHASRPRAAESAGNLIYAQHKTNPLPLPPPHSIPQPSGGADRNAVPLYAIDNLQVNKHLVTDVPIRGSALRGLGAYANIFAIESFMDELAEAAAADPFEFRERHLRDARAIEVLKVLKESLDWQQRPAPGTGVGWGLAFAQFKNLASYLGVVMQLTVNADSGDVRLAKATAVCDAGLIINPDGVRAQIEGGIIQSASWTLKERVEFAADGIKTRDWNDYPILRFDEVPEVEVILIDRKDRKSLGVGETAQGPTAAAIANAIRYATGKRLRQLPFTADPASTATAS